MIREGVALPSLRKRYDTEACDHVWHPRDCVQPGEALPLEMARGCIFKCKFCRYPFIGKSKNDFSRRIELVRDESLGPESSRLIGKAWSGEHARTWIPQLYHDIWQREVTFRTSWIVGIPPDTREDLLATHQWAIDSGLPNWKWHVLNINRDQQSGWVSEFDRNADQYGFDWYTENGQTRWMSAQMTWRDAKSLQNELETLGKPYQVQDCWG